MIENQQTRDRLLQGALDATNLIRQGQLLRFAEQTQAAFRADRRHFLGHVFRFIALRKKWARMDSSPKRNAVPPLTDVNPTNNNLPIFRS